MSTLYNSIKIEASPDVVWDILKNMSSLHQYDPAVLKATLLTEKMTEGLGASRQCDLKPSGWFREKVTEFIPKKYLTFELYECTLPVKKLKHRYELRPEGSGTIVSQEMVFVLKYGFLGTVLDKLMVSKQFDKGIKGFLAGLKSYIEGGVTN